LFDLLRFLVEKDFPMSFPAFSQFALQMMGEMDLSETAVLVMKQLKETFFELGERKGSIAKKHFEEQLRQVLNTACELSVKLKEAVVGAAGDGSLSAAQAKLSKYCDQIAMYILRVAPADIMDEPFSKEVTEFLLGKLQMLLSVHSGGCNKPIAALL
jgi:hypothetical protein